MGSTGLSARTLRRLQTGRDLVREPSPRRAEALLVAFGGIDFAHHGQPVATRTAASPDVSRATNDRVIWELKPLEPLPASAEEVRAIATLYRSSRKSPSGRVGGTAGQ